MRSNDPIETVHDWTDARRRPGRSPLAWLPWLGMNLIAFVADAAGGTSTYPRPQTAAPPCNEPITAVACCNLACPNTECPYPAGDKSKFTCPDGYTKTLWTCCCGTRQIACGECAGGNSCANYPWACSILYNTGLSC